MSFVGAIRHSCIPAFSKATICLHFSGDNLQAGSTSERDVFNEKPTKDEVLAATRDSATAASRLAGSAILHTTLGDIHLRLWARECPRTVENFVGHARAGFYNGHIFHRVIKGFMIQTGCSLGRL